MTALDTHVVAEEGPAPSRETWQRAIFWQLFCRQLTTRLNLELERTPDFPPWFQRILDQTSNFSCVIHKSAPSLAHLLYRSEPRRHGNDGPTISRALGAYYTPEGVVRYVLQHTLGRYLSNPMRGNTPPEMLDPACGSGLFLVNALERLLESNGEGPEQNIQLLRHLRGWDVDAVAVETTRMTLLLTLLEHRRRQQSSAPFLEAVWVLESSIELRNALTDQEFTPNTWDIVLGNPPFFSSRKKRMSAETVRQHKQQFQLQGTQLQASSLFLERSLELVKERGYVGFVLPKNWLTVRDASTLRGHLLNHSDEVCITHLPSGLFQGVTIDACVLTLRSGNGAPGVVVQPGLESDFPAVMVPRDQIQRWGWIFAEKALAGEQEQFLLQIQQYSIPLGSLFHVSCGLKVYQRGKGHPPQGDEAAQRAFHGSRAGGPEWLPYLEGSNVGRYLLKWSGQYLRYGSHLAEMRRSVPFEGPRLLIRQIPGKLPNAIYAAYTEEKLLHDINIMVVYPNESPVPLRAILAVINSRVVSTWFDLVFDKLQRRTFPQFKISETKQFPVPACFNEEGFESERQSIDELCAWVRELEQESDSWRFQMLDRKIEQQVSQLFNLN